MQLKPTAQLGARFCLLAACWKADAVLEGWGWTLRNAHGMLWRLLPRGSAFMSWEYFSLRGKPRYFVMP